VILVFCRFRKEVDLWVSQLKNRGYNVLGCKGGEVNKFLEDYRGNKMIQCICTTSALSHGVNLLNVSKVFFSYPVTNRDLWFQMVGRGGRTGEAFEFFGYNSFLKKERGLFLFLKAILYDFYIYIFGLL
jgi:superfamily II helicase